MAHRPKSKRTSIHSYAMQMDVPSLDKKNTILHSVPVPFGANWQCALYHLSSHGSRDSQGWALVPSGVSPDDSADKAMSWRMAAGS